MDFKENFALDRLDTRLFRAFQAAAHTLNFTHAAKLTAMTQSGISQQISKLEEQVGSPLFKRLPKSMQLTNSGKILLRFIEEYNDKISALLEDVSHEQSLLSGRVSYAMPNSCLASPHLPLLLERRKKEAEKLILEIEIIPNDTILQKVLDGQIDFGFMTIRPQHPLVESKPFCEEEYVLMATKPFSKNLNSQDILEANFLSFPGMEVYFHAWKKKHFPTEKNLIYEKLKIMASISTLEGAFKLLRSGVGWVIMPKHALYGDLQQSDLFLYEPKGKEVKNMIFIVSLKDLKPPKRVSTVISWFFDMVRPGG